VNSDSELIIWDAISSAWTEIGLADEDYPIIANQLLDHSLNWEEIHKISVEDVCGSFAFDAFLIFPCMLWMIMPDWGYSRDYLRQRIQTWKSKPTWVHFINPIRLLGYPLAILMSHGVRNRLRVAYENARQT
jgi:hypothetical protein